MRRHTDEYPAMRSARRLVPGSVAIIAICGLLCLLAAGGPGIAAGSDPARQIDVTRLDPAETEALGWDPKGLDAVFRHAATLSSDVLMIVTDGRVVGAMGDPARPYNTHSMRKAFLSALVGRHLGNGPHEIPLEASLEELGINDEPRPLTPPQRQATVLHLLKSVSGINHPAAAEEGLLDAKKQRLGDGENEPGKIWAYNNWDYNALTTIFERRTGLTVAEAFAGDFAQPLGMQDFGPAAVTYIAAPDLSRHRAAAFRLSGRDLARFGQLYLDRGMVDGKRLLSEDWIARITRDFSVTGEKDALRSGHGYLWWIPGAETGLPDGTYWAWGLGQQGLFVIPAWHTVIVHQSDMTAFLERFIRAMRERGLKANDALEEIALSCLQPANRMSEFCIEDRFVLRREFHKLISLIAEARRRD